MAHTPTKRQADLLRFIAGYIEAKGYAPSRREMKEALGLVSTGRVQEMILGLEERGWLRIMVQRARAIEILTQVPIPRAPDGAPLHAVNLPGVLHG